MHIFIDQSPRIEDWTDHSVIAFSNSQNNAVIITSQLKREAKALLEARRVHKKSIKWILFAAGIYLAIKDHTKHITHITIDADFDRKTNTQIATWVMQKLTRYWREQKLSPRFAVDAFSFESIKRKNYAHVLAYSIFTGAMKPKEDIRVKRRALLKLLK